MFRGDPLVDFRLPLIVQCDTKETEDAIRALGFGEGKASWPDQLKSKFLISVDGNGATCSRVVIALKSNSVLLKYRSVNLLYYFSGLNEYFHYIPVNDAIDIRQIVKAERRSPGLCKSISEHGSDFYLKYLTAEASKRYAATLLEQYARIFYD